MRYGVNIPNVGDPAALVELAAAGATWAIDGPRSPDEPWEAVRRRIDAGPPT